MSIELIEPHGGHLKDLYLDAEASATAKDRAQGLLSWDMTQRQMCDVEL